MSRLILFAAVALLTAPAAPQDVAQIFTKVAGTYGSLTTFEVVETNHQQTLATGNKYEFEQRSSRAAAPGGKFRLENAGQLIVSDGKQIWEYHRTSNEYTRQPGGRRSLPETAELHFLVKNARIVREEPVELDSGPVPCWVIEAERDYSAPGAERPSSLTYWIDRNRFLVLKTRESSTSRQHGTEFIVTRSVARGSFGQPVPDSLFRFEPPEGAVEVEQFSSGPKSELLGSVLPDFELKGPSGDVISPATLRGKFAVLGFHLGSAGSSDLLAFLELLHRAFRGPDLVAASITIRPLPEQTAAYSKLGYTMPAVVDETASVSRKLGISSASVVIADRGGKILFLQRSSNGVQQQILSALRKAGLW